MENYDNENQQYITIIQKQKEESPEKNVKDPASSSNDETLDAESNDKSIFYPKFIVIDQNYKFFLEFSKLHEANLTLNAHLTILVKEKSQLKNEIQKIDVLNILIY